MSKMIIEGGKKLGGCVDIHGAKNAVLPILAATLISGDTSVIENCPNLRDVASTLKILKHLGCECSRDNTTLTVDSKGEIGHYIPENLMREMRSSIIFLGAIISRCRKAFVSYPGGCELGPRPIDLHLKAFRQLGVTIEETHGFMMCSIDKIVPCHIHLDFPSVGATENIMLLTAISDGKTVISNAAKEPEIVDLQNFLNEMGAKITGSGTQNIVIEGVSSLHNVHHKVIADRIVATSYLAAGVITGSSIQVNNTDIEQMSAVLSAFSDCGQEFEYVNGNILLKPGPIKNIEFLRTMPHPGFPTDAQALISTVLTLGNGTSVVSENIFENRFRHLGELTRMGADVKIDGRLAVIRGVQRLTGAKVVAGDLRGAAALIIAGLVADGVTEVDCMEHLFRGYDGFDEGLCSLGANIMCKQT